MSPQKQKHVQKVQVQLDSTCGSGPGIEKIREGEWDLEKAPGSCKAGWEGHCTWEREALERGGPTRRGFGVGDFRVKILEITSGHIFFGTSTSAPLCMIEKWQIYQRIGSIWIYILFSNWSRIPYPLNHLISFALVFQQEPLVHIFLPFPNISFHQVEAERTALHAEFDVERAALRKERKRLAEVAERQRSQLREERENAEEKQRLTDRAEQLEEEMKEKDRAGIRDGKWRYFYIFLSNLFHPKGRFTMIYRLTL